MTRRPRNCSSISTACMTLKPHQPKRLQTSKLSCGNGAGRSDFALRIADFRHPQVGGRATENARHGRRGHRVSRYDAGAGDRRRGDPSARAWGLISRLSRAGRQCPGRHRDDRAVPVRLFDGRHALRRHAGLPMDLELTTPEGIKRTLIVDNAVGFAPAARTRWSASRNSCVSSRSMAWIGTIRKNRKNSTSDKQSSISWTARDRRSQRTQAGQEGRCFARVWVGRSQNARPQHHLAATAGSGSGHADHPRQCICSWHRLTANYTFGGARAYMGRCPP